MGLYVDIADLVPALIEERIAIQLTNDEVDGDAVVESVITETIADAEAEVDGYLGTYYSLPLANVPRLVQQLAGRVTRYRLYSRRPGAVEEWLEKDYDAAIKMLDRIAKGTVTLGSQPEPAANEGRRVRTEGRTRVFGRDNLDGY